MDAHGSHVRLLVDAPTDELAPIWSPDGRSIAFVSNAKGDVDGELWAADADGSHRRRLHEGPVTFADWSPDGTRIAFSGPVSGEHRVSVLDIASGETTDLGPGELPRWSPDGARLAVSTADFTAIEIIRVADQRRVRLAYLLTRDHALAEDLVQEAFVRLAGRLVHLRDPGAFDAYLRRTVVNLSNSHFRRKKVERAYLERTRGTMGTRTAEWSDSSLEDSEPLWQALGRLSGRQRAALVLRFYEDLSERQV